MKDPIERQDAIDAVHKLIFDFFDICDDDEESPMTYKDEQLLELNKAITTLIKALPSAQPERLTDDDFETIRIHLNAYKENLCNQQRWKEAEEYQRLIDRFMAFASAQPEIIRCKDCKHRPDTAWFGCPMASSLKWHLDGFCSFAERRTDETD